VGVKDEAYVLRNRATERIGPATTKLTGAVHSIIIPTFFLLQKRRVA